MYTAERFSPSATIPSSELLPSDWRDLSRLGPNDCSKRGWDSPTTRHSFAGLQIVEKAKELVPWSIPFECALQRLRFAQRFLLHCECGFQIDLSRFHGFMPEPHGNDRAVHSPLQQVQGHGVAQDMDGDAFAFQRRTELGGSLDMTDQQVMHAVGAETCASGIGEQNLPVAAWRFAEPGFQHGDRRLGERYTTFLTALPDHTNVSTRSERDIIAGQPGQFGLAQSGLRRHQEEGVIAPSEPVR